jgi:SAM-dependent methyltransferase
VWDKSAPGYDKQIAFFEKIWFGGGREWLGQRAHGRILEVAIGTGLNPPHYPVDATVTGVELSPAMLAIARQRAADLGPTSTCVRATPSTCPATTRRSTPWSARCRCARSPIPPRRSAR